MERDLHFETLHPLSAWADAARAAGAIPAAEQQLSRAARPSGEKLPPRGG
ncbi:DUF2958 domain-containing protein [Sphingomonas sp.]